MRNALREIRDVQYQDLLQRQRDERAAFNAGHTLDNIHLDQATALRGDNSNEAKTHTSANENRTIEVASPLNIEVQRSPAAPSLEIPAPMAADQHQSEVEVAKSSPEIAVQSAKVSAPEPGNFTMPTLEAPEVTRQVSDFAAGAIGAAANYLADQLGELFAPTPPEVREAQAKAAAKAEAERPVPDEQANPYARQIAAAMRIVEAEREQQQQNRAYWEERDKGKDFERDR